MHVLKKHLCSMHKHVETNDIYTDNLEQRKFLKHCNKLSSSEIQVVQETKLLGVKDLQDKSYRILQEFQLQSLLVQETCKIFILQG